MAKIMMTIHAPQGSPTLQEVIQRYAIEPDEIDSQFGVVPTDPDRNEYTILIEQSAANKVSPNQDWDVSGPYSNPIIETFDLPKS